MSQVLLTFLKLFLNVFFICGSYYATNPQQVEASGAWLIYGDAVDWLELYCRPRFQVRFRGARVSRASCSGWWRVQYLSLLHWSLTSDKV